MLDGQHFSSYAPNEDVNPSPSEYFPSATLVLQGLGVSELELAKDNVVVSAPFLRFLIGELARFLPFDAEFYAAANPDVEAARLAGDVTTLHEHFVRQGFFERRQPHDLPFDAFYYATQYQDIAGAFAASDAGALHNHFVSHGWHEGRAAVSWQRADADRWVAAARAG